MSSRLRDTVRYLFELYCEVSPGDYTKEPQIESKFPESYKNEEELKNIPKFTFPCQFEKTFVQHYSFVWTSVDSKHTFCFCRFDPIANTSLVVLSHLPWHDVFYKLLNCIANLKNSSEKGELTSFLEACRIRPPMPGHTLKVTYNAGHSVFSCQSPGTKLPSIPDNFNLTEYFSAVDSKCMVGLWAALLHERRIAIIASKPSRLSACVQASNATLFPMSWQHIFIPLLPKHLVDCLLAPMPFLIGVPRTVWETVRMSDVGDIVILDVDANELRSSFRDVESLPTELVSNLRKALHVKNALGDTVSRTFLRALVCLIGGYRDAIRIERGELITFNPEAFVRTRKNMQPFLRKILQSQIFQQFIDERLDLLNSGRGFNDEFEVECNMNAELLSTGSGQRLKQQYRDWAKNVKKEGGAFFKTVKDKANPAVQSAVKSVRQGGKNVKSAVRGLKNRIPKTSSKPSSINTMDDSRYSCGSATPVSSDSSDGSPSHAGSQGRPEEEPLDLLTEMEFLFKNTQKGGTLPSKSKACSEMSVDDKAKTLTRCIPPRIPDRPKTPPRYPIIPTRKLVDISDAPIPPPRADAPPPTTSQFVSNIVKNEVNGTPEFHTSTISFSDGGKDKAKLTLTLSTNPRKSSIAPPPASNGRADPLAGATFGKPHVGKPRPAPRNMKPPVNGNKLESIGSDNDLIKLDDSPPNLEDFDPLKTRDKDERSQKNKPSADSALLHEYGLDFSQFNLLDYSNNSSRPESSTSKVPKGWTTFN